MFKLVKCSNRNYGLSGFLVTDDTSWEKHLQKAKEYFLVDENDQDPVDEVLYISHPGNDLEIEIYGFSSYSRQFAVYDIDAFELSFLEKTFNISLNKDYYLEDSHFGTVLTLDQDALDGEN